MTLAFWCVVISGLLPLGGTAAAKWGFKGFDNHNPRDWLSKQTGTRARGIAAEKNSHESFPFFAAAVLMAHITVGPQTLVDSLAAVYVVARVLYLVAYLMDWAGFRTLVWLVGLLATVAIATAGAWLAPV
ncbi:MAG: MAPEG family protein [Burkholderiaceae bacterium]